MPSKRYIVAVMGFFGFSDVQTIAKEQYTVITKDDRQLNSEQYTKDSWYMPPKRYILAVMAFFGFFQVYSLRVIMNIALVAMTENKTVVVNGTLKFVGPEFTWTKTQIGLILSSFYFGYIITQMPAGFLAGRFGGKHIFGGGVFLTAIFTLLIPTCVRLNVYLLIAMRILEGIALGVTIPSIFALLGKWSPPADKSTLSSIAFAGGYIGIVVSMVMAGVLAESCGGWPSIFYFSGSVALIWYLIWCIIISECPADHPTISKDELDYILTTKNTTEDGHPPWCKIFSSAAVWAVVIGELTRSWGFYTWVTQLPSFMKFALGYDLNDAGGLSALPYLVMSLSMVGGGIVADFLRLRFDMETTFVRKIFFSGGCVIQAALMIGAGYSQVGTSAIVCLTLAFGIGGLAGGSVYTNHLDIAPQYASILMGISNTFATLSGIVSPSLTELIVDDKYNKKDWQRVFNIAAAVYIFGSVTFGFLASGNIQSWADNSDKIKPLIDRDKDNFHLYCKEKEHETKEYNILKD